MKELYIWKLNKKLGTWEIVSTLYHFNTDDFTIFLELQQKFPDNHFIISTFSPKVNYSIDDT